MFTPRDSGGKSHKYCSRTCNMRAWRRENKERNARNVARQRAKRLAAHPPIADIVCICGKAFKPRRTGGEPQKYCSKRCSGFAWRGKSPNYLREYYAAHRDEAVAYARDYRKAHPEEIVASRSASWMKHREKNLARLKAYREANTDKLKASNIAWRKANKAWVDAYNKIYQPKWRASKPGIGSHYMNNRRAKKDANGGSHTLKEWQDKCAAYDHRCAYCGEAKKLTRDHVIPLCRGGSDNIDNIVPCCKPCNSRKARRTSAEYLALSA